MYLPEKVLYVLDRLEENKYDAYLVGGCVRDSIMGKTPNDYDITTNALPQQILECFSDCKTLTNGIKHGTVGVVLDKEVYEVTTYRIDGEYTDNRHPDKVEFSSRISDDLSRRDFTVNAIACDKHENMVDPFDGNGDIQRRLIKCVGEPDKRFNEDALRIIRALRFSSVLDFDIAEETVRSVHRNAHLLGNVSAERINIEFGKLLCGKRAGRILREFQDVIAVFADKFESVKDVDLISGAIDKCKNDIVTRLSVFACGFLDSDEAESFMRLLKYDNETRTMVVTAVSLFGERFEVDGISVKKLVYSHGFEVCALTNEVQFLLDKKSESDYRAFAKALCNIKENGECTSLSQLAFDGNDCKSILGITGRNIGLMLEKLCYAVIEEKVLNEHKALLEYAIGLLNQQGERTDG